VDAVLLASGGMDSSVLAYYLLNRGEAFAPLFVDYGQHGRDEELRTLREVLPAHVVAHMKTISIADVYGESSSRLVREADLWSDDVKAKDLYLPYRNLVLLSVAAAWAQSVGAKTLYSGFINSNHAQEIDATTEFLDRLAAVFEDYGGVRVQTPFRQMSKSEVAKLGLGLGVPLGKTFSCQANSRVHCGACPNCVERLKALEDLA
jgi:7-cyano-7-deazaguanine synthase